MKTELTPEQKKAVYDRGSNILVSAAAGSGKTKVLVDRIISKILDKENPVNVDEFLVVTFTNAAAAQMKEKIGIKLSEALTEKPENEHLLKQQMLINRANITTIDSFCLKVVKENINRLDIDTSFTIGDNGMLELIKADVIERLFNDCYGREAAKDGFLTFVDLIDIFDEGKSEENLRRAVLNLYKKAVSYPNPKEWLHRAKESLMVDDVNEISGIAWYEGLVTVIKDNVRTAMGYADMALHLCFVEGGPSNNVETIEKDKEQMEQILKSDNYETICGSINVSWSKQISCKTDDYDKDIIKKFQDYRNKYKKVFKELHILCGGPEKLIEENKILRTYLVPLLDLVIEFFDCYKEEKKQKKIMDFSDIAYYAYELLVDGTDEEGELISSKLAKDISEEYKEIFIDEYQDSNYLQEYILTAVSGMHRDDYNMFMVGDVKQSIYRFRMARPDLFISKYNSYNKTDKKCKIELNNNFRSRDVVLLPVNYFFYQLMGKDLGGITYDNTMSLVPAKQFPKARDLDEEKRISQKTELLTIDVDLDDGLEDDFGNGNISNLELEAHLVAKRILELVDSKNGMLVYDEEVKSYRNAEFKDIVILFRSLKKVGDIFYNVLSSYGIPVYLEDSKGYFNAVEIKVLMSLLSVVDNSRQDIPLAAVLMSPMADIKESELAVICDFSKAREPEFLYDKCQLYILDKEDAISDKLRAFFDILEELKEKKKSLSISSLVWLALERTNYYSYVAAMPMGQKRRANIDMLLQKADSYEDGYYKGLFNFLRYVDKLKTNNVDFGEASVVGKDENVVRIYTMHSSKGLEYPIVFVSALGKKFNEEEYKDKVIVHSDYYVAAPIVNIEQRYTKDSISREVLIGLDKSESIAEELRILYVAMTRAEEKLILTGVHKDYAGFVSRYEYLLGREEALLPYNLRKNTHAFIDIILKAMLRYNTLSDRFNVNGMMEHTIFTKSQIMSNISKKVFEATADIDYVLNMVDEQYNEQLYEEYKDNFMYQYPYEKLTKLKGKMSISDIKKQKAYDGVGYDDSEFDYSEKIEMEQDTNKNHFDGAKRGTIIHKFMELVPFELLGNLKQYNSYLKEFLEELKSKDVFSEDEAAVIDLCKLKTFFESSLGQRMIKAAVQGKLVKEQQFSVGIPVSRLENNMDEIRSDYSDVVIVQGIIDAFFYEDDEIVVMDYKTDRADEETLIGRYRAQLDYYGATISQITGKRLKGKIIYSFSLGKEIVL